MKKPPRLPIALTVVLVFACVCVTLGEVPAKWGVSRTSEVRSERQARPVSAQLARSVSAQLARAEADKQAEPEKGTEDAKSGEPEKPGESKSDEPEQKADSPALEVLKKAREELTKLKSVRANISEKVSILDHSFTAKGSYLQGSKLQSRLEFTLELGGNKGSLLEICDGQLLWTRHEIADQPQITRRDVREILKAAELSNRVPQDTLVAALGLGGLPALLAAFEQEIDFDRIAEDKIDQHPVTVIEGKWNKVFRSRFENPNVKEAESSPLPLYVPDSIRIYFDKETDFPRRILYLKQVPNRKLSRPMLTIDFTNVKLNEPVSPDDFTFVPPSTPVAVDVTQNFLQRLAPAPGAAGQSAPAPGQPGVPDPAGGRPAGQAPTAQ